MAIAALAGGGLGIVGSRTLSAGKTSPVVSVGKLGVFAPGSATKLTINRPYLDVGTLTNHGPDAPEIIRHPQAEIFIVRDNDGGVNALIARDTHSGCVLSLNPGRVAGGVPAIPELSKKAWFFDPCHGSDYDQSGAALSGPTPRNLDRFSVVVDRADVLVDVGLPIRGARRG